MLSLVALSSFGSTIAVHNEATTSRARRHEEDRAGQLPGNLQEVLVALG